MAFDGGYRMTSDELLAWEGRIRHAFHKVERKQKRAAGAVSELKGELEAFADALATDQGIDPAARSGGHDKPEEP